jgi:hypothetical protein
MFLPDEAIRGVEAGEHATQVALAVTKNQARSSKNLQNEDLLAFLRDSFRLHCKETIP